MQASDAIKQSYNLSHMVLNSYVGDLSDDELRMRPHAGCNHIAWQLGHLIHSEISLLDSIAPGHAVELPAGFAEKHSKENAASNDSGDFHTRDEYMSLFAKIKDATFAALDSTDAVKLDDPAPERLRDFCGTVGGVYVLIANHVMMHAGQWVPVRRSLEKPIVI